VNFPFSHYWVCKFLKQFLGSVCQMCGWYCTVGSYEILVACFSQECLGCLYLLKWVYCMILRVYGGSSCERLGGVSRLDFCMKWI
jgi:hypothetical protein